MNLRPTGLGPRDETEIHRRVSAPPLLETTKWTGVNGDRHALGCCTEIMVRPPKPHKANVHSGFTRLTNVPAKMCACLSY